MITIEPSVGFVIKSLKIKSKKYGMLKIHIYGYHNDKSFTIKVSDILTREEMCKLHTHLITRGYILVDSELLDDTYIFKCDNIETGEYVTEQSFIWSR